MRHVKVLDELWSASCGGVSLVRHAVFAGVQLHLFALVSDLAVDREAPEIWRRILFQEKMEALHWHQSLVKQ